MIYLLVLSQDKHSCFEEKCGLVSLMKVCCTLECNIKPDNHISLQGSCESCDFYARDFNFKGGYTFCIYSQ